MTSTSLSSPERHTNSVVLLLPPSEFLRMRVIFESRKGMKALRLAPKAITVDLKSEFFELELSINRSRRLGDEAPKGSKMMVSTGGGSMPAPLKSGPADDYHG